MEEFAQGVAPFGGEWAVFCREFKARFETVNEAVDIKEKLQILWQSNSTVSEYAALFKELMSYTGYLSVNLRDRFYDHLHPHIKNELVHTAHPIDTLNGLITVASDIDIRLRQH
jgi:Retrotransposon gag protein